MEYTATFFGRLVVDTMLVGGMVGCRIIVAHVDSFVEALAYTIVTKLVVDRMVHALGW